MATWGKLEQVEVAHLDGVNSRDVPESLGQALDLVIDDERSQLLDMPPVLICQLSCAWWSRPWQHQPRPCSSSGTRQPPWSWSNKEGNLWVPAMAEQIAYFFWLVLTFLCHLLQVLVGGEHAPTTEPKA
jgi:hypothetical protein